MVETRTGRRTTQLPIRVPLVCASEECQQSHTVDTVDTVGICYPTCQKQSRQMQVPLVVAASLPTRDDT